MITFSPENYRLYSHVGRVYYSNGNLDEAIKYIKISIDKFPTNSDLYGDLGNALATKGDIDEAVENFKKSVFLDPDNYKSHFALGNYLNRKGGYSEAIPVFRRALELFPNQKAEIKKAFNIKECYYGLALALFQTDKLDEVLGNIQKAIEISPKYFDAFYLLGNYYNKKGEQDKALEIYNNALTMAKEDEELFKIHFIVGITNRIMNRLNESIESLEKAVKLNPRFVGAVLELGNTYIRNNMYSESVSLYKDAISKFSSKKELEILYKGWGYTLESKGLI
jgi:superkiller protein 3